MKAGIVVLSRTLERYLHVCCYDIINVITGTALHECQQGEPNDTDKENEDQSSN
jgi:hypothetical protein